MHPVLTRFPEHFLIAIVLGLVAGCSPLPHMHISSAPHGPAPAVVLDVDGTLTPRVAAIFSTRPDAATAAQLLAKKGYEIFYLSARHPWFSSGMPDWLRENGFPEGSVRVAQTLEDYRNPVPFKTGQLKAIAGQGWDIVLAYGDSSTDFQAYAEAGLPHQGIFALKREGEELCQPGEWAACLEGWTGHLDYLSTLGPDD